MKNQTTLINSILSSYKINTYLKNIALILFGTLLLALSSKVQVPFWPVPMTMQTFMVFIIGMTYGWKLAFSTLVVYLIEGAIGLPVFAKGGGLLYLTGPTAGYLYGMTIAAGINNIIVLSWSTKIFFIAGSNNHAMAPVDPATTRDKRTESKSLLRCFLT